MTVTCATVRRAFGEFECCGGCHYGTRSNPGPSLYLQSNGVCCNAVEYCVFSGVKRYEIQTHPALLKELEEEAK